MQVIGIFFVIVILAALGGGAVEIDAARPWPLHVIDGTHAGADGVRLADINGDGRLDVATGFEEGNLTRVFLHPGGEAAAVPWPAVTIGRTPSVEDAVFIDLDGDGNLDVVSACEGGEKALLVHWNPGAARLLEADDWRQERLPAADGRMQWMFAVPFLSRGTAQPVLMAGGKGDGAAVGYFAPPEDPRDLGGYRWHGLVDAGWIMTLLPMDMDGDGDQDLLFTDRRGPSRGCRWLEQTEDGAWPVHDIGGTGKEVMFLKAADLDGDGVAELVMAVKTEGIHILTRRNAKGTDWSTEVVPFPEGTGGEKAVAVGDLNGDGRADIALSCEGADAPKIGVLWLEQVPGKDGREWPAHAIATEAGIKYDRLELLDIDGDGDLDLMTCEEREGGGGLGVVWYENPIHVP